MQDPSAIALTGFIAWALALLVLMELLRTRLVVLGKVAPNEFQPDNSNLSSFMQRLARAHANCVESLPVFGGLLVVALVTGQTRITDPMAFVLLAARILQSSVHLASLSPRAVTTRFVLFTIQLAIAVYWASQLLLARA
jgi:uncharacterized MAPEG superfamily protein